MKSLVLKIAHGLCLAVVVSLVIFVLYLKNDDSDTWVQGSAIELLELCEANYELSCKKAEWRLMQTVKDRMNYSPILDLFTSQKVRCDSLLDYGNFKTNYENIFAAYWDGQPSVIIVDGAPIFKDDFKDEIPKSRIDFSLKNKKLGAWDDIWTTCKKVDLMFAHRWYSNELANKTSTVIRCNFGCDIVAKAENFAKVGETFRSKIGGTCGYYEGCLSSKYYLDGDPLPIKDGKGIFEKRFATSGKHTLNFRIELGFQGVETVEYYTQEQDLAIHVQE